MVSFVEFLEHQTIIACFVLIEITVRFDNSTYTVNKDGRILRPLLILSNPSSFVETIQVIVTIIGTTNTWWSVVIITICIGEGIDYNFVLYNVSFPIGSTNASFDITISSDTILEDDEVFNVSINSVTNGHTVGTPGVATVTIIDTTSEWFITCIKLTSNYIPGQIYLHTYVHTYIHKYAINVNKVSKTLELI